MKVEAFVTYKATLDIGDVPYGRIEVLLKDDDGSGDFNVFEQGGDSVVVHSVELVEAK